MATPAQRRLMNDLKTMQQEDTVVASPLEDNIMEWEAVVPGPEETPWEGGLFSLRLSFSDDYPNTPPKVKFTTPGVFHPNVYVNGDICLDILKSQWSPSYDVRMLLISIQSLLAEPNPGSAANPEAAELLTSNKAQYEARVKRTVEAALAAMEADDDDDEAVTRCPRR
jgi:ubiquitin-conjugating enzyme E2 A